jgi:hypothetical protein
MRGNRLRHFKQSRVLIFGKRDGRFWKRSHSGTHIKPNAPPQHLRLDSVYPDECRTIDAVAAERAASSGPVASCTIGQLIDS